MPTVDIAPKAERGPAWGCTCPAHRPGEPSPGAVLRALAKAALVTVEPGRGPGSWTCWTEPDARHEVVFDPEGVGGGFCKHVAACLPFVAGEWTRLLFRGLPEPTERVRLLGGGAVHWLRPGTAKTLCGQDVLDGRHWARTDGEPTCGSCERAKGD